MTSLARLLAGLVLFVSCTAGALVLSAGPAAAMDCAEPSVEFLDGSDVAFAGVVAGLRQSGDDLIATVRVDRVFQGTITRRVDVVSRGTSEDSGLNAGVDDPVIVFGKLVEDEVTSHSCGTVGPGDAYRPLLSELGEGTSPIAGYMKAESRSTGLTYRQFSVGRAILGVFGLSAMGFVLYRAWRARRRTT